MKKVVSLILSVVMLLSCFTACGTDKYKDYHATNMEAKTFTTYYDDLIFETDTVELITNYGTNTQYDACCAPCGAATHGSFPFLCGKRLSEIGCPDKSKRFQKTPRG